LLRISTVKTILALALAAAPLLATIRPVFADDDKTYSITLFSDEGKGKMNGHVFIALSDGTETMYRGWYSNTKAYTAVFGTDGGRIQDDTHHEWDVKKTYTITKAGYKKAVDAVTHWEKSGRPWSVQHHCGDFAEAMGQEAGVDIHLPIGWFGRTRPGLFGGWLESHGGILHDSEAGRKDIAGVWKSDWGPVTINGSTSITGSWKQGPDKIGVIKSGHYDPATGKLTFKYFQHWNNQNGNVEMTLSSDGKTMSGAWTQESGSGGWTMTRD